MRRPPSHRAPRRRRRGRLDSLVRVTIVAGSALVLIACADDGAGASDAERFCGEAIAGRDAIMDPPVDSEEGLAATLEFYRLMGRLAPLAIAEQWNDLVVTLETASTVVPGDPESEQRVALQAYASERSAYEVHDWILDNCGLDLGPITTIAPQGPAPTPAPEVSTPTSDPAGTAVPAGG